RDERMKCWSDYLDTLGPSYRGEDSDELRASVFVCAVRDGAAQHSRSSRSRLVVGLGFQCGKFHSNEPTKKTADAAGTQARAPPQTPSPPPLLRPRSNSSRARLHFLRRS
uniref:Uncharacterized protein n=1 Tax=Aegilops tauschii subsp. strangulata TaxID=200361 RepID=A0A453ILA5_AEGTS